MDKSGHNFAHPMVTTREKLYFTSAGRYSHVARSIRSGWFEWSAGSIQIRSRSRLEGASGAGSVHLSAKTVQSATLALEGIDDVQ